MRNQRVVDWRTYEYGSPGACHRFLRCDKNVARLVASAIAVAAGIAIPWRAEAETVETPSSANAAAPSEAPPPFGSSGQFVLSVDRLAGVAVGVLDEKLIGEDVESDHQACDGTKVTAWFLEPSTGSTNACASTSVGGLRWGADIFVVRNISLGGSMSVTSESVEHHQRLPETFAGGQWTSFSNRAITLSPRVGYVLPLGSSWSFWPRVGVDWTRSTIHTETTSSVGTVRFLNDTSITSHSVNATLDGKFVFSPIAHVALFGGPYARLPIWNSRKVGSLIGSSYFEHENNSNNLEVGATGGALVYF